MNYFFTLIFASLLFIGQSFAQANFEGTIKFKIEYEDLPEEMVEMEEMLPKEMVTKIKGNKNRTEQNSGMGNTINILDGDKKSSISLINMMGNKIAVEMNLKEMEIQKAKMGNDAPPEIEYADGTKKIAGYICKEATITIAGTDETVTIFFTSEIQTQKIGEQYEGFEGFPMQYKISAQGLTMVITATSVTKETISKSEFTIPEDYKRMTSEEFQKSIKTQLGTE